MTLHLLHAELHGSATLRSGARNVDRASHAGVHLACRKRSRRESRANLMRLGRSPMGRFQVCERYIHVALV